MSKHKGKHKRPPKRKAFKYLLRYLNSTYLSDLFPRGIPTRLELEQMIVDPPLINCGNTNAEAEVRVTK